MLKPTIFREYDIRGIADSELLSPDVEQLGRGLGTYLRRHGGGPNINVGRDCRLSSTRLRDALVEGPARRRLQRHRHRHGPHSGALSLGAKPERPWRHHDHRQPQSVRVQRIQERLRHGHAARRSHPGSAPHHPARRFRNAAAERCATTDAVTPYVDEVAAQFRLDRRIKVVADAGNGTAGPVIHRIFEKLNVDATELFFEMDGHFPNHHPDPTVPANLAAFDRESPRNRRRTRHGLRWRFGPHRRRRRKRRRHLRRSVAAHLRARNSAAQARRHFHRRSEMLAGDVRPDRQTGRQRHHV